MRKALHSKLIAHLLGFCCVYVNEATLSEPTLMSCMVFKQNTVEALKYPTNNDRGRERATTTGNYSPSKLENFTKPKEVYSHIHSSPTLFSFCIQLICSSHSHSYTICTCYTLSSSCGHWPISPNPAIIQLSGHFALSSIYCTWHTTHICKQLYIATLHLSL